MGTYFEKGSGRKPKNAETRLYTPSTEEEFDDFIEEEDSPEDSSAESAGENTAAGEKKKQKKRKAPVVVRQQREISTFERVLIMACTFIFAAMVVFILSGYERITRAYADINTLTNEIDKVNLHISELNVSIECAVTIEQSEEAALEAGMIYPTQEQIYTSSEHIPTPVSGVISPVGSESTEDTVPEDTVPDENRVPEETADEG